MAYKEMTYDQKSYDLAEYFLEGELALNTDRNRHKLAQVIQEAIESEIIWMRSHPDKPNVSSGGEA